MDPRLLLLHPLNKMSAVTATAFTLLAPALPAAGPATAATDRITLTGLQEAIALHTGEIEQIPPMYSALKKDTQESRPFSGP